MRKMVIVGLLWTILIGLFIRVYHLIVDQRPMDIFDGNYAESTQIAAIIGIVTITVFARVLPKFDLSKTRRYLIGYGLVMGVYFIVLPMYDGIWALMRPDTYYAALIIMILVFPLIKFIERNAGA